MAATRLTTQTGDFDLTSIAAVLSHTPDASNDQYVDITLRLGTVAKPLDGSGGKFQITVTIGDYVVQTSPQAYEFGTVATASPPTSRGHFVAAGEVVTIDVLSPNSADTDVTVTAILSQETTTGGGGTSVSVGEILTANIKSEVLSMEMRCL